MFNELFTLKKNDNSQEYNFACVKSINVQAYPCGRRRFINTDPENIDAPLGIPFDPEARLNTEANNRKASAANGYTNTYLTGWDSGKLSLSLAGYQFNIDCLNVDYFIEELSKLINNLNGANKVYANIVIQNVPLSSGDTINYYTGILRNQPAQATLSTFLDMFYTDGYKLTEAEQKRAAEEWNNYYFSGLSFSTIPLVDAVKDIGYNHVDDKTYSNTEELIPVYAPLYDAETSPWSILNSFETDNTTKVTLPYQQIVSLCILKKDDGDTTWQVYQPALLPQIVHGDTPGSIKVSGDIKADSISVNGAINTGDAISADVINANEIKHKGSPIITLHVATPEETGKTAHQLQFSFAKK